MATHAETPRGLNLAKTRDWLAIAAAVAVVVGALAAGMQWAVTSAVAPLYAEMRGVNDRMDRMDKRLERIETQIDNHSGILAELRERLTRVETILLERGEGVP